MSAEANNLSNFFHILLVAARHKNTGSKHDLFGYQKWYVCPYKFQISRTVTGQKGQKGGEIYIDYSFEH